MQKTMNIQPNRKRQFATLAFILAQLALAFLVIRAYELQTLAFRNVFLLACGGFIVNHLLPPRFRPTFFASLSVFAAFLVLGGAPDVDHLSAGLALLRTTALVVVGVILIAMCWLPVGFWVRVALIAVVGAGLALFRAGVFGSGPLGVVWIVVASMFMLRMMIYLYDLSTSGNRPSIAHSLGYFFMIPNVCVPFFPVIDFKNYCRGYYNEEALVVYQRGVNWIARGVLQLILYRFIEQLLSLNPAYIENGTQLVQYIVVNAFLYLKISGSFHLIVGMLLLFGFNLPETNHRYFLASSFTDYWRRVNIYWKDFMMRIFYYPAYFRMKKLGGTGALVIATIWTFFVTWALHLYQTWWLKGSAAVTLTDGLFWMILGALVLVNSLWEMKYGRKRTLAKSNYTVSEAIGVALRTAGVFTTVCLLWSLWSSSSLSNWIGMWKFADLHSVLWAAVVLVTVMAVKIVWEVLPYMRPQKSNQGLALLLSRGKAFQYVLPMLAALMVFHPRVQSRLTNPVLTPVMDLLTYPPTLGLTGGGGYYEQLTGVSKGDLDLWETLTHTRIVRGDTGFDPRQPVKDVRFRTLVPDRTVYAWETEVRSNRWGMRDRDYPLAKPTGTVRIATLGSSQVMGYGVPKDEVFDEIIENRLNGEPPVQLAGTHFEIMNFAIPGYNPLANLVVLQKQVRAFKPDIVILVSHWTDFGWSNFALWRGAREHVPLPDPFLDGILREARVTGRTPESAAVTRLEPLQPTVLQWVYNQIVKECQSMGAQPVWTFLPVSHPPEPPSVLGEAAPRARKLAIEAGFVVLETSNVFDGQTNVRELLTADPSDPLAHWNAKGHALFAEALYQQLTSDPRISLTPRPIDGSGGLISVSSSAQSSH